MKPETFIGECPNCKSPGPHPMWLRDDGIHHADVSCIECDKHWFAPKPDAQRTKRPKAHRELVDKFSRGFCELCLIPKNLIPKGETLHGHHVDEFRFGGAPLRENVWILCTACHTLVHNQRVYRGHLIELLKATKVPENALAVREDS